MRPSDARKRVSKAGISRRRFIVGTGIFGAAVTKASGAVPDLFVR
jgi:hypothetical protein